MVALQAFVVENQILWGVSVDVFIMDDPGAPFRPVRGESAEVLSPAEVSPSAEVLEAPWAEMWEPVSVQLSSFFSFVYGLS